MGQMAMGSMEEQFMEMIWANAPVVSGDLVKLAAEKLGWKKSTTYTVLRRLADKGLVSNEDGVVRASISQTDYKASQTERVVNSHFEGSLPSFIAAFTSKNTLSQADIERIRKIIDDCGKEDGK